MASKYSKLTSYNENNTNLGISAPVMMSTYASDPVLTTMASPGSRGFYVVPAYASPGYDTLNRSGHGGYISIGKAYKCNVGGPMAQAFVRSGCM